MKRIISALGLLTFAATIGLAGCGSDDENGGGGTAGKTSTAGKGNEPTAGAPPEGDPNVGCKPSEETVCQNDTDCPFVVDGTARTTAQDCGKGKCLGSEDENCARDCMLESLEMTSECAGCYADFVNCTIANCVGACIADPDSDGCHECQQDKGCRPTFNTCSGLPE